MIDELLRAAVAAGHVPNAVAVVATDNGVGYEGAAGPRAVGGEDEVTPDSLFRMMSMTKMVTTVTALRLAEQGKLDLAAPVEEYRPEFAEVRVLDGFDGDRPILRPPATRATVHHLVTHTTGLSYKSWNPRIARWEAVTGTPPLMSGSERIFTAPMAADPGTTVEYGINTDWLGRVVEAVAGQRLDVCVKENVTGPLGMASTTFTPSAGQRANLVPIHTRGGDGRWVAGETDFAPEPEYLSGGHGMYSTPRDYLRFQRMLLGHGALDGVRILERSTVDKAFTNQVGTLFFPEHIETAAPALSHDFSPGPGHKWGYGLLLNTVQRPGMRAVGSGGWLGLCNSHYWIDPANRVTAALYTQSLPFGPPDHLRLYADFERAVYASLRS